MLYENGYTNLRSTSWSRELREDFDGYENVEYVNGDLREVSFCENITKDVDVVFHCADKYINVGYKSKSTTPCNT